MATLFGGIALLVLFAIAVGLNVSAHRLERRLSVLVDDQLDRVRHIEHALAGLKSAAPPVQRH